MEYNYLDNNFTVFEPMNPPEKVELNLPLMDKSLDISDWATGISDSGIPIVRNNIVSNLNETVHPEYTTPKMIIDNNPEQDYITTSEFVNDTTSKSVNTGKNVTGRPKQAVEFFKSKFINELHLDKLIASRSAMAIVGNLMVESGDKTLNITDKIGDKNLGPQGNAYGMGLWRLDRKVALKNFAAARGKPMSDFNTQLEFVWDEILGSLKNFKVLEKLINSSTIEEATKSFMDTFERPSSDPKVNGIDTRIKYAKSLLV